MLIANSFIFFRRLPSLKLPRLTSKYVQSYDKVCSFENVPYFRRYSQKFLQKPVFTGRIIQYSNNLRESRINERYKHTSDQRKESENVSPSIEEVPEKLSLFKRYHKMLKEYWYVLLPVHCVTSALWFGGFYYAAQCGIDIVPFLEYINVPETFIKPLRSSSLGYIAVASAFYKLATPARYMVTLGGTTFAIKFLTKRGLIRPAPTKAEIKTIIQNKLKKDASEKQP